MNRESNMPITHYLSGLKNNLLSASNIARLVAGITGILITVWGLYAEIINIYPSRLAHYALNVGVVIVGLVVGILVAEAGIWIAKKLYTKGVVSEGAGFLERTTGKLPDRPKRTRGNLESSRGITPATRPKPRENLEHSERKTGYWFPTILVSLILLTGLSGWAVWHFYYQASNETASVNVNGDDNKHVEERAQKEIEKKPSELRPALLEYCRKSPDINEILSEGLEEKNIGGASAVAVTNWQFNSDKGIFKQPEELGFQKIANDEALVNRARKNDVVINQINIRPLPNRKFGVTIKVTNRTVNHLRCAIPKGQIFEIKDAFMPSTEPPAKTKMYPQGLAKANGDGDNNQDGIYVIPPLDEKTLEIIAYCLNENLAIPHGIGNIAIYELKDKDFNSPDKLHMNMRRVNLDQIGFMHQLGNLVGRIAYQ
jgi:hypothetical protein